MTGLTCLMLIVGSTDLVRGTRDTYAPAYLRWLCLAAAGLVFGSAVLVDSPDSGWWAWVLSAVCVVIWLRLSSTALAGVGKRLDLVRLAAATSLATAFGAMVLAGENTGALPGLPSADWLAPPAGIDADRWLFMTGLVLVELATANVLVRMFLDAAGVPASTNEKDVKGGRLLGPMERVFIVTLGGAGQLAIASAVVAAKALLRFPEASQSADPAQPKPNHTEYLLLGSFSSWLLALLGVGLTSVYF